MTDTTLPTVRLNPKGDARAIRHGFPWVYANEVVMDRRTKGITACEYAVKDSVPHARSRHGRGD